MSDLLGAALAYAARGWPVFPCAPGSKVPATAHGFKDASTDPDQIRAWWTAMPDANVAIATGAPGPDVIDVDVKNGDGYAALARVSELIADADDLVSTPSGGGHLYFTGTSQRNGRIPGQHLDFRGAGGYVLAPPSTVDGRPYRRTASMGGTGPADWGAVRALLDPPPDPAAFQQPIGDRHITSGIRPGDDWASGTTWEQLLIPCGWRKVRDLGNGRACWCRPGKTGPFTSATTRDDGGLYVFSTSTPFDVEVPYSKFGALAVLEHGGDHAAAAAQLRRDGYGTPAPTLTLAPAIQSASDSGSSGGQPSGILARYPPVDWQQLWDDTPDDEEWILEPLLAAGRSIALYSPPKAGKSLLMLEIVAALVTGRPVLGRPASKPRKVLYVDLENSRRDLRDRLIDLGYKPADLDGLVYLSFPSLPMLDSAQGGAEIVELATVHQADVVVIDTVSRVISGKENDADTFAALYRYAMAPLKGMGISVARLDHAGKDLGRGQRGSSAKNADVDAVWTLTASGPNVTLSCDMSRTVLPVMGLSLRRQKDPLRHEPTTAAAAVVDKLQETMAKLDELGVPRDDGRIKCQKALNHAGFRIDTNALAQAVATRKRQPDLSDDLEGASGLQTGPQAPANLSAGQQTGSGETAGQTCLDGQQTGADRLPQGTKAEPVCAGPPTLVGARQTGSGAAVLCTACGEHHPPGACYRKATG